MQNSLILLSYRNSFDQATSEMVYKDYFIEFIEKKDYHLKRAQDNILALENTILSNTKHITQQLDDLKKLKDELTKLNSSLSSDITKNEHESRITKLQTGNRIFFKQKIKYFLEKY